MERSPFVQLSLARMRELVREPEALFWVFVFPVLLAIALAIAFRTGAEPEIFVGVEEGEGAASVLATLDEAEGFAGVLLDGEGARQQLRAGKVAVVVRPGDPLTYWFDPTRPESRLARLAVDDALQRAAGREDVRATRLLEMREKGSRYIDFLVPGLLGMNLMGTGMWGIGFNVVNARQKKMLRRLVASPMRRSTYLVAQMAGRLVFLVPEAAVLIAFALVVIDVPQRGSWTALVTVIVLGALAFTGLGLLVAARPRTIEGVSGLMNFVMLPMWIGSGVFFSTARFPEAVQPLLQALPLTAINDALRAVMLEGAPLAAIGGELVITAVWTVLSFAAALAVFRWS
jgi:ABC-type multidrug transport system permease subunit